MNPRFDCCVVGLGARTPVGLRAFSAAAAVRAGVIRLVEHPCMVDVAGDPLVVSRDPTIESHEVRERMLRLASSAIEEAVAAAPAAQRERLTVHLGLPECDRFFGLADVEALCQHLAAEPALRGLRLVPVPEGNAAGAVALTRALTELRAGAYECCVVAGVDSLFDADRLEALGRQRRIIARDVRWGFTPGEGAGAWLVCTADFARAKQLPVLARIAGLEVSHEPCSMHTDSICTGEGLAAAMRGAAAHAGAPVTRQYCDINGERYRELEMSYAILRVPPELFVDAIDYVAPADAWGHVGAASIPLLGILPIVAHARGFTTGRWPMIWSGSERGWRGAIVLHLPGGRP